MSRFELPRSERDLYSILDEYRPKKSRGNDTEADRAYEDFANPVDGANSFHPAPFSPPMNSSTVNVRGHNDELGHSRLDEIAEALRTLTYGEMLELAESMWKVNSQGSEITESDLPSVLYRWSTSRSIEN
jgi:hypothetical protein